MGTDGDELRAPTGAGPKMNETARTATALGIHSPWSGDERDPIPRSYWWWFALYRWTRIVRHRFGVHDRDVYGPDETCWRCAWCGKTGPIEGLRVKIRVRVGNGPEREVGSVYPPTPEAIAALLREVADCISPEK
jgi:hypothetical protein